MSFSPSTFAIILFMLFIALVALVIAIMLYRDLRSRQNVYSNFSTHLNEFIVIMTKDGHLQDVLPKFVDDPLYEQLCQNQSFESILSISDLTRLNDYIRGLDAYPDIPFIFSFLGENGPLWYELRASVSKNVNFLTYLIRNVTVDVESRNQRDELQKKIELMLQNTGDFLWNLDVEKRQFSLLTPVSDDEGRVVPRSVEIQDVHTVLPKEDFEFFERIVNARVVDFRSTGRDNDEGKNIRLRLYGQHGNLVWYALRCKAGYDENGRLVLRGTARRMDVTIETSVTNDEARNALLSLAFSFPDVRIFCLDRDYKFVGCNLTFAVEHSISDVKHVVGKRAIDVITTKYYPYLQSLCSSIFETGRPVYWRGVVHGANQIMALNVVPVKNDGIIDKLLASYIYVNREDFDKALNLNED